MPQTPLIYPQPDLTPQGTALMVDEVARLVGAPDDPELRTAALVALDRAADRMNMAGLYLYRRQQATFSTLTEADTTVPLPSDWAWPVGPVLILDADGVQISASDWVEWDTYQKVAIDPTSTGVPTWFSILNEFDALAHFYPAVDSSTVGQIVLTYCARIQHPSEAADDQLYFTPETRECLISGGQFLIMQHRYAGQPGVWAPYKGDFDANIKRCKASAARQLAGARRQIQVDTTGRPDLSAPLRSGVYVRIG
jgi:hypothetical protein